MSLQKRYIYCAEDHPIMPPSAQSILFILGGGLRRDVLSHICSLIEEVIHLTLVL